MTIRLGAFEIKKRDWILILGLMIAPMTGWRIFHIGPGEVLVFLWCLPLMFKGKIKVNAISRFFLILLSTMFVGTIWCYIVARDEIAFSHWPTWIYLSIVAYVMYFGLSQNSLEYNNHLFETTSSISTVWYLGLYIFGRVVSRTFIGAPLWYYNRFTGGASNPHQFAIMACGLVFCFIHFIMRRQHLLRNSAFAVISFYLLSETKSSTGIAAVAVSILIGIALFIANTGMSRRKKTLILTVEVLAAVLFVTLFYRYIYSLLYEWVASDANGLERFTLFSNIKNSFLKSPIFGLGPGNHSRTLGGSVKEYHNMYLEIIAASGVIGTIAFIAFSIRLIRQLKVDYTLILIIVAIYAYGVGGFALRRLPFWVFIVFSMTIAEQMQLESNGNSSVMEKST